MVRGKSCCERRVPLVSGDWDMSQEGSWALKSPMIKELGMEFK